MKDGMEIYRAHLYAQRLSNALLLSHRYGRDHGMHDDAKFHMRDAVEELNRIAAEIGCVITWPVDAAADDAAVELSRKLEQEDADRADTIAEYEEMVLSTATFLDPAPAVGGANA